MDSKVSVDNYGGIHRNLQLKHVEALSQIFIYIYMIINGVIITHVNGIRITQLNGVVADLVTGFCPIWATHRCAQVTLWHIYLELNGQSPGNQCFLRARALWGKCTFLYCTDRPALRLGEEYRIMALQAGTKCLCAYSTLSGLNLQRERLNYKVRPKWYLGSCWNLLCCPKIG